MKENDTEELSNSMFLNVITSSFFSDFPKTIPRGVARFFHFRVELTLPPQFYHVIDVNKMQPLSITEPAVHTVRRELLIIKVIKTTDQSNEGQHLPGL